jgi:hypothetical protein
MKTLISTLVLGCLASPLLAQDTANTSGVQFPSVPEFKTADTSVHGLSIAEYAELRNQGWKDEVSQGTMTLFSADGDSVRRTFSRMVLEQHDMGDKLITKFTSPAEIRGVSALTHEHPGTSDDNWLYLPANKRVRRISGANNTASFQGTEFTYEDLSNIDPTEYNWRFVETTKIDVDGVQTEAFKLDAKPTYKDTGYSHIIVYFGVEHFRQERIEYFDKAGVLLKVRTASKWRLMHGRFWRAYAISMDNQQTGKRTSLEQSKVFLNLALYTSSKTGKPRTNLTEERFTTRAMQQ